jgi:hypothetical protein
MVILMRTYWKCRDWMWHSPIVPYCVVLKTRANLRCPRGVLPNVGNTGGFYRASWNSGRVLQPCSDGAEIESPPDHGLSCLMPPKTNIKRENIYYILVNL